MSGGSAGVNGVATLEADRERAIRQILVVDDSSAQRRLLSTMLTRWGYSVIEAASGAQALEIVKYYRVDLILSDWIMPGMSGVELCERFRALEREHYGYFILLTSKSEKEEVALGLELGADDFLCKPVELAELRARITAGERILRMERALTEQNELVTNTLSEMSDLYETLDRDLLEAKKLQQSLVRERHKEVGKARISLLLNPSGHVGGDLVGMFPIDVDHIGLFAIDVSGHGITSALITARLAGFLSGSSPAQNVAIENTNNRFAAKSPALAVAHLNELCQQELETEHYFTLLLANLNVKTGELTLAQAGHPHPIIQRRDGALEYIGEGGVPVGLVENASYVDVRAKLGEGDRLFILSDGFSECPNPFGKILGDKGLGELLQRVSGRSGPELLEDLVLGLEHFAGDTEFPDDISAVMVEFGMRPSQTPDLQNSDLLHSQG